MVSSSIVAMLKINHTIVAQIGKQQTHVCAVTVVAAIAAASTKGMRVWKTPQHIHRSSSAHVVVVIAVVAHEKLIIKFVIEIERIVVFTFVQKKRIK